MKYFYIFFLIEDLELEFVVNVMCFLFLVIVVGFVIGILVFIVIIVILMIFLKLR